MTGVIYTIGHGRRTPDGLASELHDHDVSWLVDVRSAPYSRWQPEFCRSPLEAAMQEHALRYVFLGDAVGGRPKHPACMTDGRVDYAKVRQQPFFLRGIDRLCSAHAQGLTVCLLCAEGRPETCHRAKLIGPALRERRIELRHIGPDGGIVTQSELERSLEDPQRSLFG